MGEKGKKKNYKHVFQKHKCSSKGIEEIKGSYDVPLKKKKTFYIQKGRCSFQYYLDVKILTYAI